MRASIPLSILLHAGAGAALVYGWGVRTIEPLSVPVVPIEILTEAELSELLSVPEMMRAEEPEDIVDEPAATPEELEEEIQTDPEPLPEPVADPEPVPPPVEEEPAPPPPQEEIVEEKPHEPPAPKPDPPKDELDLADLAEGLKDLDPDKQERRRPSEISGDAATGSVNQERIGDGTKLTIREQDLLKSKLDECWTRDAGVPNADQLIVRVEIVLNLDGTLSSVRVVNDGQINRSGSPYWAAFRTRAVQAVYECAPYDLFDPANYRRWRSFTFNFIPE